jgi:hypothetical protein
MSFDRRVYILIRRNLTAAREARRA